MARGASTSVDRHATAAPFSSWVRVRFVSLSIRIGYLLVVIDKKIGPLMRPGISWLIRCGR